MNLVLKNIHFSSWIFYLTVSRKQIIMLHKEMLNHEIGVRFSGRKGKHCYMQMQITQILN